MTVQMIASKPFRLTQEKGFRWVERGDLYTVADKEAAEFHETTGRGKRKAPKPAATKKGA